MNFAQSNIKAKRTFNSWNYELIKQSEKVKLKAEIDRQHAEMYYNGGYSPKMVINEINRIPPEINIFHANQLI